jgi:acyl-CoA-binding protein
MSELKSEFEAAAQDVQNLPRRPDNDTLLELYAFYKQATSGDASGKRPGFTDPVGRSKFDAWSKKAGMSRDAAMEAYIALANRLK